MKFPCHDEIFMTEAEYDIWREDQERKLQALLEVEIAPCSVEPEYKDGKKKL